MLRFAGCGAALSMSLYVAVKVFWVGAGLLGMAWTGTAPPTGCC
ncbi:hypothetical protein ACBJ59_36075 [Nonomuraea sp. MTCD27]